MIRRTYEDRVVALLGKRGVKGIPSYSLLGTRGQVEEAELREAIAKSGAEGVLITRVTRVDQSSGYVSGATVSVGYGGYGGVGMYGYYGGVWETVDTAPQKVTGPTWMLSETRLFDAKSGTLAWTGIVDTRKSDDAGAALTDYVNIIFDAMVSGRVL
jgi:hypothetical protein